MLQLADWRHMYLPNVPPSIGEWGRWPLTVIELTYHCQLTLVFLGMPRKAEQRPLFTQGEWTKYQILVYSQTLRIS